MKTNFQQFKRRLQDTLASFGLSESLVMEYGVALLMLGLATAGMMSLLGRSLPDTVIQLVTGGGA